MTAALDGVKVVDFGHYIAGPLAAVMLSDQGADVIHVDPPGGPRWNTPADAFLNRGKRRISLDLKTPDGLAMAQRLVERADVLIQNFPKGTAERYGIGYDQVRPRKLDAVHDEPRGWEALGTGPLQRFYRASDGCSFSERRRPPPPEPSTWSTVIPIPSIRARDSRSVLPNSP